MRRLVKNRPSTSVFKIPLKLIEQNENSRVIYKETDVSYLMHSLQNDGQLQAVGLRKLPSGKYEAVFGNRRIVAARKLGWHDIDAKVLHNAVSDNDRDILNLIENMNRQNTTVYEDGRIMQALLDRGLTAKEISARLNCSEVRIDTAISVYGKDLPKEYRKIIVNTQTNQRKPGTISATAATQILHLRRRDNLTRPQTRSLLDFAKKANTTVQHITQLSPLMGAGLTLKQAIQASSNLSRIALFFFMDKTKTERLEKNHGKSINDILLTYLESNPELGIKRALAGKSYDEKPRKSG